MIVVARRISSSIRFHLPLRGLHHPGLVQSAARIGFLCSSAARGYTSRQALQVLPYILPSPEHTHIKLLLVFFGANDASLPKAQNNQHVPLDEYQDNLAKIISHPQVVAHAPKIVLVAPPPINEYMQWNSDQSKGLKSLSRKAAITKTYADAVVRLAQSAGVPVINLWEAFMAKAGWKLDTWKHGDALPGCMDAEPNDALADLMYDVIGLHLNPAGYDILFDELMKVIGRDWPDFLPQHLPNVLPLWNDPEGWESWRSKIQERQS
ncbi:unnamed protein product [Periconia digitata]|uniref:SGNH hydrolase-type esterase domain-containing protein n=1 Tax=Periconia digitata TaxID=1303443 RepID=A0A9W4UM98_9PLEO|nr:unnamed protein product [Periconia digitata]